ncbi:hypothetical protein QCD79_32980, partial [Pseudomonas quasicaspiana]|nr:hypothetical protein [Pseudomonas quasicaspiana]
DIPHVWPEAVLKEAAKLKPEVEEKDKENRVDLRHLPFFTVDGDERQMAQVDAIFFVFFFNFRLELGRFFKHGL